MKGTMRIRLGADDLRISLIIMLLVIGIAFLVATVIMWLGIPGDEFILVWADDSNDVRGCILPQFCNQMAEMTQRDITMSLELWNNAGCSIRDICTPADGQCEQGDTDCLTSLPDPDYNKTTIAPQIQNGSAKH